MADSYSRFRSVVLDTTDPRGLAEFYRQLLGYSYRAGHPFCMFVAGENPAP